MQAAVPLLYCELRLGLMAGLAVQELVESTTGEPCPCKVSGQCPLKLGRRPAEPLPFRHQQYFG